MSSPRDLYGGMEKHQAFLSMMARKKEEHRKAGEDTSSSYADTSKGFPLQTNFSLKTLADQPAATTIASTVPETTPPGSGSKGKASREKYVSSNKKKEKKGGGGSYVLRSHFSLH